MALRLLLRYRCRALIQRNRITTSLCFSDELKNKNISEKPEKTDDKSDVASKKLNLLLQSIIQDDNKTKLPLARPKKRKPNDVKSNNSVSEYKQIDQATIVAAKNAAVELGGNVETTQSELLAKLLDSATDKGAMSDISNVIANMKIDRSDQKHPKSRSKTTGQQEERFSKRITRPTQRQHSEPQRLTLFGTDKLSIFPLTDQYKEVPQLETWDRLQKRELRLAVTHPPQNYFQQMILWTEQGKLWNFPIDNEQGMDSERDVYFTEHIFLDKHLEGWCPKQGPIRHFMELVCVGLSKNHWLSATEKQAHIEWFQNYFMDKSEILKSAGALPVQESKKTKSLE